jgi:HK97 family phage prohead protease
MSAIEKILSEQFGATREVSTEVRRAAFVPEVRAIDEAKRTITFVASTEAVDRYGDIVRVKGWQTKNYERNPVFLWGHKASEPPIGRTLSVRKEANPPALVQTVEFADAKTYPFAETVFQLYKQGFMKAVSVGFRPLETPKRILDDDNQWTGGYEFTSQELLELSAVPIPANPEAVARAIDSGIVTTADATRFFASEERGETSEVLDAIARLERTIAEIEQCRTARDEEVFKAVRDLSAMLDSEPLRLLLTRETEPGKEAVPAKITSVEEFERVMRGSSN